MTDLDRLIAAVEAGKLQDQPYFGMPMATACYPRDADGRIVDGSGWSDADVLSAYHGSLDAALRLHEALLPGWDYCIDYVQRTMPLAYVEDNGGPTYSGEADSPARAVLLAILRAVKARGEA